MKSSLSLYIAKWLFLCCLHFWCITTPCSSANREGRCLYRHIKCRCCLSVCNGNNKFYVCNFLVKVPLLTFMLHGYISTAQVTCTYVFVILSLFLSFLLLSPYLVRCETWEYKKDINQQLFHAAKGYRIFPQKTAKAKCTRFTFSTRKHFVGALTHSAANP